MNASLLLVTLLAAVTGEYFWCPPAAGDRVELKALGI